MGRSRKRDKGLPRRVYRRHGAFYFVDAAGKWVRLGTTEASMYAELARLNLESRANAMSDVIARYRKEVVPGKAARTQRDNERELALLNRAFGHMTPGKITAQHIYQYMDARSAPVRANREKALLSHVFKYAIRWGVVTDNPCRLVVRNTERPRTRYVDDAEFLAVYDRATTAVQAAMRLAVLTGMRCAPPVSVRRRKVPKLSRMKADYTNSDRGLREFSRRGRSVRCAT